MLTVDFDAWGVAAGELVLDLGCGAGRHSFEALKRGARVVAVDLDDAALKDVCAMGRAMNDEGEIPAGGELACVTADALRLPFRDGRFDRVIASEILEHIPLDGTALDEIARVTRPGGHVAVTVPRWWPERICWWLSQAYRTRAGGHVRIYRMKELVTKVNRAGLEPYRSGHAHALHSPYWWLKCLLGLDKDSALVDAYHRFLVWDIMRRPPPVRLLERALNPLMGKSVVLYARSEARR